MSVEVYFYILLLCFVALMWVLIKLSMSLQDEAWAVRAWNEEIEKAIRKLSEQLEEQRLAAWKLIQLEEERIQLACEFFGKSRTAPQPPEEASLDAKEPQGKQ